MPQTKVLDGLKIVVTRSREQSAGLASALDRKGAIVIEFPTIEIFSISHWEDPGPLDRFDWAVFTSANAVTAFAQGLKQFSRDVAGLKDVAICAIGPGAKRAVERKGLTVRLLPAESIAESVLDALHEQSGNLRDKRILLPQGKIARPFLLNELKTFGARVTAPIVYDTVCPHPADSARDNLVFRQPQLVTFTSASTAENFRTILGAERIDRLSCAYASIGPQTTAAATHAGFPIAVQPAQYDIPSLVQAIVHWARK